MRRRLAQILLVVIVASGLPFATSSNAWADTTLTVPDGVLYDDCQDYEFTYALDVEPGYDYEVYGTAQSYGPDGLSGPSADLDGRAGTASFFFCGEELPGVYTVQTSLRACDYNYNCYSPAVADTTFRMRKPRVTVTLKATLTRPSPSRMVRLQVKSFEERPKGFFLGDYADLCVEQKVASKWRRVKGSKVFVDDGTLVGRVPLRGTKMRFRGVRLPYDGVGRVTSKPVTVTGRR